MNKDKIEKAAETVRLAERLVRPFARLTRAIRRAIRRNRQESIAEERELQRRLNAEAEKRRKGES